MNIKMQFTREGSVISGKVGWDLEKLTVEISGPPQQVEDLKEAVRSRIKADRESDKPPHEKTWYLWKEV